MRQHCPVSSRMGSIRSIGLFVFWRYGEGLPGVVGCVRFPHGDVIMLFLYLYMLPICMKSYYIVKNGSI